MSSQLSAKQSAERYGKVAVLMGGNSAERVISLETGRAVHAALCRKGVDAVQIDARANVIAELQKQGIERVFNALHGRGGEDGVIQGVLDTLSLPYTGSGVLGSALAMDKIRSKQIWQQMGLSTPDYALIENEKDIHAAIEKIGVPLMVKPVHEGSSCGASKVSSDKDVKKAWQVASQYQDSVMAERWIEGIEYTAAILAGYELPLIRLQTPHEFYDYSAKYEVNSTQYICPCGLDEIEEQRIRELALEAFNAVGASGWGRVDLFIDDAGRPQLLEVNTVPGMTSHSLVPMAAAHAGLDFDELVLSILDTSLERHYQSETAIA